MRKSVIVENGYVDNEKMIAEIAVTGTENNIIQV